MKVLKIGAVWCPGCIVMRPRWQEIEKENPWLKTEYYEYDDSPEVVAKYGLKGENLPVFIFLNKDGEEIKRLIGEVSKKDLLKLIEEYKDL